MSLSLLKTPKVVLTDDFWPIHPHGSRHGPGMTWTQIPSAGLKALWNGCYWSQTLLPVCSLPYKTSSITSALPCTSSDAIPASRKHHSNCPALPELPILTTAAFPCRFLKPQTGCIAQDSQNLDTQFISTACSGCWSCCESGCSGSPCCQRGWGGWGCSSRMRAWNHGLKHPG